MTEIRVGLGKSVGLNIVLLTFVIFMCFKDLIPNIWVYYNPLTPMIAATSAEYSQQSHDYQSWLQSIWVIQDRVLRGNIHVQSRLHHNFWVGCSPVLPNLVGELLQTAAEGLAHAHFHHGLTQQPTKGTELHAIIHVPGN